MSVPGDWQDEAYWELRHEAKEYIAQMAETIKSQKAEIERLRTALNAILAPECSGYQGAAVIARTALL